MTKGFFLGGHEFRYSCWVSEKGEQGWGRVGGRCACGLNVLKR